jgi:predicted Rossmann fold flavoprotein
MTGGDIHIIGGGASGLAAAVTATRLHCRVFIHEANDRVGKKLLATGNGKCNLTNIDIEKKYYHSNSIETVEQILNGSPALVANFFKSIGLHTMVEQGRVYPYSKRAGSVLDTLRSALGGNVELRLGKQADPFEFTGGVLILSTGGLNDASGNIARFLEAHGHTVHPPFPALTALKVKHAALPSLKGIRVKPCKLTLNGVSDTGEVQFTEYGLSGIPAMQLSGFVKGPTEVHIDLLPDMSDEEARRFLNERALLNLSEPYTGLFHKNLGAVLSKERADLKDFVLPVTGVMGYNHAQVTGGGLALDEIDPATMESKLCKRLFVTGELLDVYGDCGGYNLHWAWTTGILAGRAAARTLRRSETII